ncbi:Putative ribonuclease H protein At1g65750 [Linum perenne]
MRMTPPQADRGDDDWVWGMEKDGKFSIQSAYRVLCNLGETMIADPWLPVWKWRPSKIVWDPGPPGWVTLSTDSSVGSNRQGATAGGLLRDDLGRCLLAFTINLGNCSITRAELTGAIEGLHQAWRAGYRRVLLQLDSKSAISLLTKTRDTSHQHGMEVLQFRELSDRDWVIKTKHTYREGNHAADLLASLGYGYPLGSHTILTTNSQLVYFLRYDCMGITEQRSILIND